MQGVDGNFYGVTLTGGSVNEGTIFQLTPGGQSTVLHSFGVGADSAPTFADDPTLTQGYDGNFYGTLSEGGSENVGIIFKITPTGSYTILHTFGTDTVTNLSGSSTPDGERPEAT